ncbi:MAG: PcfK-like family protein [Clostridia bacterium]|nr:PcfK-like family protein [Clostridia bacterium]
MIKLDLETKNEAEKRIKDYLENNVSETLAEKINNGVHITKDEKILINKKTLSGFMKYAGSEAKKLAEKGANFACIEDTTVYGWAIHYFEEESIEGNLYNEDGSEYKVAVKTTTPKPAPKVEKPKKENNQQTLFDLMNFCDDEPEKEEPEELSIENEDIEESDTDIDDFTEEEIEEALESVEEEMKDVLDCEIDTETGEVKPQTSSFDKEIMIMLYSLLDGKMEVK